MTAAAYSTNLTTFWLEGATTVTALGGGGAALGNPETDFFIQSAGCISKGAWTNAVKGFIIDALATTFTVPTDGAVIGFIKYDAQGSLDTQAGGGLRMIVGSGAAAYDEFFCAGSDTIEYNSWVPYVIDPNTATPDVSGTGGAERWVGCLADLPTTSGPTKGNPIGMDAIRYGRCDIEYTLGDVTPNGPATFDGAETTGNVLATRWGLLELLDGAFQTQGFHSIGIAGTAVDFRDSDKVMFWRKQENNLTNDAISTAFNRVEIINASTICQWTNIIWSALGTRSPGTFVHTAGTCDLESCQFFDWGSFTFLAAANVTNCVFSRGLAVTAPGTDMTGSSILTPNISANTSGLIWNVNTDPTGLLDNMTFTKTAGTAHHAIEFGTSIPTSNITLNGCAFGTDFSAGLDTTVGDETFHFLDTTGTITLNLVGCTGNKGYRSEGVVVTIVDDPVVTLVHVVDDAGDDLQNARVLVEASSAAGDLPYDEEVTLTRASTTASVEHTAHGMKTGDLVAIRGSIDNGYNGVHAISNITTDAYDFTVAIRTNLILQSEFVDHAYWTKAGVTIDADVAVAPDGTTTMDRMDIGLTAVEHVIAGGVTITPSSTYTFSAHVKADGIGFVTLSFVDASEEFFSTTFDFSDGSITQTDVGTTRGTLDSSGSVYLGNDIWRMWIKGDLTGGLGSAFGYIGAAQTGTFTGNNVGMDASAGVAGDDLFVWGMQVELGSMTSYIKTSRTNISIQSEDLSTWWTNVNCTDSQAVGTAPDGTNTANSIDEDGVTGAHYVQNEQTLADNITYTYSIYMKASNRAWGHMQMYNHGASGATAYFDLSGAGAVGTIANCTAGIQYVGNGWYRCWITATTGTVSFGGDINVMPATSDGGLSFLGLTQESILVWGAQVEVGSVPTEYIPTTTVTVLVGATTKPSTPASGTIKATGALISGLTDVNGDINQSRTWTLAQPIIGKVRKSSAAPFFQPAGFVDTVSTTLGATANIQLLSDE